MRNIVLIGMPACGKSTIGVMLAKFMGMDFLDSDILIQKTTGRTLPALIKEHGLEGFLDIEGRVNASIAPKEPTVIATGGSVIYREQAMEHLKSIGTVVYLYVGFKSLERRLHRLESRGVAIGEGMTLLDLYNERVPLYRKYADITVFEGRRRPAQIVHELVDRLQEA